MQIPVNVQSISVSPSLPLPSAHQHFDSWAFSTSVSFPPSLPHGPLPIETEAFAREIPRRVLKESVLGRITQCHQRSSGQRETSWHLGHLRVLGKLTWQPRVFQDSGKGQSDGRVFQGDEPSHVLSDRRVFLRASPDMRPTPGYP